MLSYIPHYVPHRCISMKYVKRIRNKLFFGKSWPKHLQAVIGAKQFTSPLGSVEQTEAEVLAQCGIALKEYAAKVKRATNSNPEDFTQNEIDILVDANLRRLQKGHGLPHFIVPDQHIIDHYENDYEPAPADEVEEFGPKVRTLASQEFIKNKGGMANSLVDIDEVRWKEKTGQKLTMKDKVAGATWVALQTKAKKKPKMLHDSWKTYTDFKRLETSTKNWDRFTKLIQDRSLNISAQGHQDLSKELNEALRTFRDTRVLEVKVATVKRELNSIKACLNFTTDENNYDWNLSRILFQTPEEGEVLERIPLTLEHQKMLIAYCLSPEHSMEPTSTMALLYLTGGVMPSEVGRMDAKVQLENLSSAIAPYVTILGKAKTNSRRRPVPVVLGLEVIRDNIEATIAWAKVPKSTRVAQMRRMLEAATGTEGVYVSHGLRHTFSMNCRDSDCRDDDKCTLGGWASIGNASAMSMRYGASGMFDSDNIIRLHKVSQDIHRKLLT